MIECLWKARVTYAPSEGLSLEAYWWSVWINRKTDIIRYSYRRKREFGKEQLVSDEWILENVDAEAAVGLTFLDITDCPAPPTDDWLERQVWFLLSVGAATKEILALCHINVNRYHEIVDSWNTEEIRRMLSCETGSGGG